MRLNKILFPSHSALREQSKQMKIFSDKMTNGEITKDAATILQLPTELLIKLFEYIPERWSIALVCRQFYEVLCKVDKKSYKLVVRDEKMVRDNR